MLAHVERMHACCVVAAYVLCLGGLGRRCRLQQMTTRIKAGAGGKEVCLSGFMRLEIDVILFDWINRRGEFRHWRGYRSTIWTWRRGAVAKIHVTSKSGF